MPRLSLFRIRAFLRLHIWLFNWKFNPEGRSLTHLTFDLNIATVTLDDSVTDGQPQPRSLAGFGDIIDNPLIFVSSVLNHGITNAQTDGLAKVKSFLFCFVKNLSGEGVDIEIKEKSFDQDDHDDDAEENLCLETS